MSGPCDVACIEWPEPDWSCFPCDPCINLNDSQHRKWLSHAWRQAVDYINWSTGNAYPGLCWRETFRPAWDQCCRTQAECPCCTTSGRYQWLPISDITCFPILDIEEVRIGPTGCSPCERVWTPTSGDVRLEWVNDHPRLVMQNECGCCGPWPRQDLCRPQGAACTWEVSFLTGCPTPPNMVDGAAAFAVDWITECIQNRCLPGDWTQKTFDGTTVQRDPSMPPSLALRILDKRLEGKQTVKEWACTGDPVSWHRTSRPVYAGTEVCDVEC